MPHEYGAVTAHIDVAQIALYAFWLFFAGLIYYLRTEDKREGFPMVTDTGETREGFPPIPSPKVFLLPDGTSVLSPPNPDKAEPNFSASPVFGFSGAPLAPLGNPLLAGAGPAAYALRADKPDRMQETGENRVVPLRVATDHYLDAASPDPRGMPVVGADGVSAGTVSDLWVDRAETMIRYVEIALTGGGSVLAPMPLVQVSTTDNQVLMESVMGGQIGEAPKLASPDQVTLLEEDRIQAYFGGGHIYAEPSRSEPIL